MRFLSTLLLLSLLSACCENSVEVKIQKWEQKSFPTFPNIYYSATNTGCRNASSVKVEFDVVCEDSSHFSTFGLILDLKPGKLKHANAHLSTDRKKVAYIMVSDVSIIPSFF